MGKETYYLQIFKYHKWIFVLTFSFTLLVSIAGSFLLPKRYQSQCTVMLEVKAIENPLAKNEQADINPEQIKTIRNLIISNNRLTRVIKRLGLDRDIQNPLDLENLINGIRENITIDNIGTGLFTITYKGTEPYQVRDIANTLAKMFIEENLELTGSQAQAEYDFIQKQLEEYQQSLEDSEKALKEFKEKNIGQMSGETNINLTRLQKLQDELVEVKLKDRELEQKKAILEKQLAKETPSIVAFAQREDRIKQLQIQLAELLSRYTENYPEVIKVKAELEEKKAAPVKSKTGSLTETSIINPTYQKIKESLNTIEIEINLSKTKKRELEKSMAIYYGRVASIPAQEEKLARLTRDKKVNEEAYEMLLKRLAQIRMVKEMEKLAQQSRFKILDPATLPLGPVVYNPLQITLICLFLSLGAGIGVTLGFEYLGRTIKDENDVQENLHVSVVANIPRVLNMEEKKRQNYSRIMEGLILVFWVILILFSLMRNV